MTFFIGTSITPEIFQACFAIVAMPMQDLLIEIVISPAIGFRYDMIYF